MAVFDWSLTPLSNGSLLGVDVAEGSEARLLNNAIRQVMTDVVAQYDNANNTASFQVLQKYRRGDLTGNAIWVGTYGDAAQGVASLRWRDEAGGELMQLDITGHLLLASGGAGAATHSFISDPSTGLYLNAVGKLGVYAGGSTIATFDINTFTVNGAISTGTLTTSGNTTLGDASGDSVTINAGTINAPNGVNFDTGNVGIGIAPPAWSASYRGLQVEGTGVWGATSGLSSFFSNNSYFDGTNYRALAASGGCQITMAGGVIAFDRFASVAAGAAQTQVESARIDTSGNLLVGTTNTSESIGEGFKFLPQSGVPRFAIAGGASGATTAFSIYSTAASAYRFYVDYDGKIYATNTSITAISDASTKENVRNLDTGLAEVLALRPVRFDRIGDGEAKDVAGFIAQEVQTVLPDLVSPYQMSDSETKLGLRMGDMLPTMVKAMQEQQAMIEDLSTRLAKAGI